MSTAVERRAYMDTLAAFPAKLEALVAGRTPEQLTTAYLDGEWTVAQNVHHLVDSHMNNYVRIKLVLTEENPPLKGYDQDVWADMPDAKDADVGNSLALLRALHVRWVRVWESIKEDEWDRAGVHSEIGAVTLDDMLKTYANHCDAHIDQVTRTLEAGGLL